MKRLAEILKWLVDNHININSIHFDDAKSSTMILYDDNNQMIELNEKDFYYYNKSAVKRFTSIRTEEIIRFLDGKL